MLGSEKWIALRLTFRVGQFFDNLVRRFYRELSRLSREKNAEIKEVVIASVCRVINV